LPGRNRAFPSWLGIEQATRTGRQMANIDQPCGEVRGKPNEDWRELPPSAEWTGSSMLPGGHGGHGRPRRPTAGAEGEGSDEGAVKPESAGLAKDETNDEPSPRLPVSLEPHGVATAPLRKFLRFELQVGSQRPYGSAAQLRPSPV
jgi:hypothetical protein